MQWNGQAEAGFTDGTPWMTVNPNYAELNVEADLEREDSIFRYYQQLIQLRKSHEALVYGDFADLLPQDESLHMYERTLRDERFIVVLNHSDTEQDLPIHVDGLQLVLQNVSNETKRLFPHEARIYSDQSIQ